MRQLSRMRGHWKTWILAIAVSGCSLPAPYQTYSPADAPAAAAAATGARPLQALPVYGGATTTPDMTPDPLDAEAPLRSAKEEAPATVSMLGQSQFSPLNPPSVSICYNRLWNKPDTIKSAAVQACGNGDANIESQGIDIDACPLLTPTKAVFSCGTHASR